MKFLTKFFLLLIVVGIAGGGVFLATWDIPAPTAPVSKTLSDDRFPS